MAHFSFVGEDEARTLVDFAYTSFQKKVLQSGRKYFLRIETHNVKSVHP